MSLESFNKNYEELVDELRKLGHNVADSNPDTNIARFVKYILPYMNKVAEGDLDYIMNNDIELDNGLLYRNVLLTRDIKRNITKYMIVLFIRAKSSGKLFLDTKLPTYTKSKMCFDYFDDLMPSMLDILTGKTDPFMKLTNEEIDAAITNNSDTTTDDTTTGDTTTDDTTTDNNELPEFLKNSTIGKLAQDISKDLDVSELGQINSFEDVMKMMSNPSGGLQKMFQNIQTAIGSRIQNGELNMESLLKESQNLMSQTNMGGDMMKNLMQSMMGNNDKSTKKNRHKRRRNP